ncbi:MAG: D-alanyl-D-alanine carboxypeptidase [Candidatus Harrisonbacteria bacterium]|nr:D-alanyl-D-alanine carboxypeptidase [Candidatus Harrisonbacteria bacterium]
MMADAKTIGAALAFLALISFARTAPPEEAEALHERITLSSVAAREMESGEATAEPPRSANVWQDADALAFADAAPSSDFYAPPQKPERAVPPIGAAIAAVIRLYDDAPLYASRTARRYPLASLTKLMTAVVAAENIGLLKTVTITEEDVLAEGDAGNFKPGETWSVRDLIGAMFAVSSNDAADALARFYDARLFVNAMQEKAAMLGMNDTSFFDPSGISPLNQSTAEDLVKLARYIERRHAALLALSATKEFVMLERNSGVERKLASINEFAGQNDFLGGKTGYTPEAHGNLISLFNADASKLLVIVLGTDARFGDTRALLAWAKALRP